MEQLGIFNQRPFPPNPWKAGTQNFRLYERMKQGPVTNAEIVRTHGIFNSTGRVSDIREFLAPHGIKLHSERLHDGKWEYRLQ